jgi:hypothetical protein
VSRHIEIPRRLLNQLRRQCGLDPDWMAGLHAKQSAFVKSKAPRKAALCTRRAGKTWGEYAWLYEGAQREAGTRSAYVTLTRSKARQIVWDQVAAKMRKLYRLPMELRQRDGQLMIELPNGSSIWLVGCANRAEAAKLRGEPLLRVVVDEAQAFPDWLKAVVEEDIEPSLMDLQGELALTGTPSPLATGYFYGVTTGLIPGWETHRWTVLDNTAIPHAAQYLAELRARNGWTEDTPGYRREWLGEWIDDPDSLVYPFTYKTNQWVPDGPGPFGLPAGEYSFGLGVDLGFSENSTAFTLAAKVRDLGKVYLLRSYTRSRMIPTSVAAHVQGLRELVRKTADAGLAVVVDEGALGAGYAEQMRSMGVHCEAAEKKNKRAFQDYVGGLIHSGAVQVDYGQCAELIDEARKLQFDPDTGKEDERYRRHCADSACYLVRKLLPKPSDEREGPPPGSPEAVAAEMRARKESLLKKHQQERNKRRK